MAPDSAAGTSRRGAVAGGLLRVLQAALQFLAITLIIYGILARDSGALAYELAGKNASEASLDVLRAHVAPPADLIRSYGAYLRGLATLDLGRSLVTGEPVAELVGRALPVSLLLLLPALALGHGLALTLALLCAARPDRLADRAVRLLATALYSTSVLILLIGLQWLLASPQALDWLPARGWGSGGIGEHVRHALLPTLTVVLLVLAVNTRFYRTLFLEQLSKPYAVFARRQGLPAATVLLAHVWPNVRTVVATRVAFTIPPIVFGGAFVIESYFGIPGIGKVSYDALLSGDRPVAAAVLGLTAALVILFQVLLDRPSGPMRSWVAP